MANSAMPENIKRETIVNEMVRRLSNTSLNHPNTKENMVEAVNDFMVALKRSVYTQKVRKDTAIAGFKTFNRMVNEAREQNKPLFRHVEEGASQRHNRKISLKSSWFNKKKLKPGDQPTTQPQTDHPTQRKTRRKPNKVIPTTILEQDSRQVESVVFIPYTNRGELKKRLQKVDDSITKMMGVGRAKYIERAGVTLQSQLVEKNIWQSLLGGCQRRYCYVCQSTKGKGISCRTEGTCYEITCQICEKEDKRTIYIGETSRSTYERMAEHFWLFKSKKEGDVDKGESNSVLWNHSKTHHSSTMKTTDWRVEIKSAHRTPLERQITEAVRIAREPRTNILNSKNEFGANNLAEICLKFGNKVSLKPQIRPKDNTSFKRKRDVSEDDHDDENKNEEATLENAAAPRPSNQTLAPDP